MLRKTCLALAAAALSSLTGTARAQDNAASPFIPIPISAPLVQVVDNHQQPDSCRSGIMGGGAVYILRPYINRNPAFTTTTNVGTANPVETTQDFDWNYHVAPSAWLGWSSECGVGGRARFFNFNHKSEGLSGTLDAFAAQSTIITPPTGLSPLVGTPPRAFESPGIELQNGEGEDLLTVNSDLRIFTIDGEATFAHEWRQFGVLLSVGGRYMEIQQNYHATLTNTPDAFSSERSFLDANHKFSGGGPTIGWQGRWQFGHSGLSVFGLIRGSIMIGTSRQTAVFTETIVDPDPLIGNQNNQGRKESNDHLVLPIGELEGGLEYSRVLGHTRLFVRGAAVNQTYFDAGSASSRDGNLSLFGAQFSIGLNY